jgi:hypothetical protein
MGTPDLRIDLLSPDDTTVVGRLASGKYETRDVEVRFNPFITQIGTQIYSLGPERYCQLDRVIESCIRE